ncbi:MAG TPA: hypothetical protein VGN17_29015 [Bryobacteraceae bacterium]|jgi:hypothetical protein
MRPIIFCTLLLCATVFAQTPDEPKLPETLGTGELLLLKDPAVVTAPYDFGQLSRDKLPLFSLDGLSWTSTRFLVEGIDAGDPYQPGRPLAYPGPNGVSGVHLTQPDLEQSPAVAYQFRVPDGGWHFSASGLFTGGSLFSANLPSNRGTLQQSDKFNHFYQPSFELAGRVKHWIDFLFTGSGRWANQTIPEVAPAGPTLGTYQLFGTFRATIHATKNDQLDLLIVGTRLNSSNYATPFGLEVLAGRRMAPSIGAQANMREEDHDDFVQLGWTRPLFGGQFQARYGYSAAHNDTVATNLPANYLNLVIAREETSYIELTNGAVTGGPLMQTLGVRPQHHGTALWKARDLQHGPVTHSLSISTMYGRAESLVRELYPPFSEAITANGLPSEAILLSTPVDTTAVLHPFELGIDDHIRLGSSFTVDAGLLFTSWGGVIPAQLSPPSDGVHPRPYPSLGTVVSWRNAAPRIGLAWRVPRSSALVLRTGYGRNYHPLSGRDLDFGNPNSLSGLEYQWTDPNHDGKFDYSETGAVLRRFGGAYSQIDPHLKQPYADQFFASAEISLPRGFSASIRAFDTIDRNRLAAVNTGVPFSSYTPVQIADPRAPGHSLTVYAQNPATFGNDQFLLTNPSGLRMDQKGIVASGTYTRHESFSLRASFFAGKSWGATNPGNDPWQNDAGSVGALYADPNTLINASGRPAMDRSYVGKLSAFYVTPARWGKLEILNDAVFTGGYPYARQLLVTGLPQGPFLIDATPRGSDGGSRADALFNWNLRLARTFTVSQHFLPQGSLKLSADLFNVPNLASKLRVEDLTGPGFSSRLPEEIQSPRFLRLGVLFQF